eukprot:6183764-Pleurochrysis_carterae.AAC.3
MASVRQSPGLLPLERGLDLVGGGARRRQLLRGASLLCRQPLIRRRLQGRPLRRRTLSQTLAVGKLATRLAQLRAALLELTRQGLHLCIVGEFVEERGAVSHDAACSC